MAYVGEKAGSGMAFAKEKAIHFKKWVAHNEGKIIAATVALAVILTAMGTVANAKHAYREQILQKFRDHGVDLSSKAVRDYCYTMGTIVNSKNEKAFRKIFTNAAQSQIYEDFKAKTPGFAEAMKDLGSLTFHRFIPSAEGEATYAKYGTHLKQNPWYRP
jgi:hypothetical protein